MEENTVNGLHLAFAFGGLVAGFIIGAVQGWAARGDKERMEGGAR